MTRRRSLTEWFLLLLLAVAVGVAVIYLYGEIDNLFSQMPRQGF